MPPLFRVLRTAGHALRPVRVRRSAARSMRRFAGAIFLAGIFVPAAGSVGQSAPAASDIRADAVGITVVPDSPALPPGVTTPGGGVADALREPGGPDGNGAGRRVRHRAVLSGSAVAALPAADSRARAVEQARLGHAATLHCAVAGHSSFHCDTPPPARA